LAGLVVAAAITDRSSAQAPNTPPGGRSIVRTGASPQAQLRPVLRLRSPT